MKGSSGIIARLLAAPLLFAFLLPLGGRFALTLRRLDGEWKVSGGKWNRIPPSGFQLKN